MAASSLIDYRSRAVRLWLLAVAALVFVMVLVGGATRLTESGLSIVEWKPVTGTMPPLSQDAWQAEFDKYKAIPQFQLVNRGMSLDEFKTIYWWEWAHRLLGRVIGAAFLVPFLWFLWRGSIEPGLRGRLWGIFALGAIQGAIGWWMVASGLVERVDVSQYRLALHLTLACAIYAAIVWTVGHMSRRPSIEGPPRIRVSAIALLALVFLQIYAGALVAGLDAGLIYNTWPTIDGSLVPRFTDLFAAKPLWQNLFENRLTVQFEHRILAYILWIAAVLHVVDIGRTLRGGSAFSGALALAAAVTIQAALGIMTLLHQVPISLALMHQAMAMLVLTTAVMHASRLCARSARLPMVSPVLSSP
jgi:cytochrome c oxidase assembly protein subunit 15